MRALAAGGLLAALVLTGLFAYSYVGALHDPQPHDVRIGVLDARTGAVLRSRFEVGPGRLSPFATRVYDDETALRNALDRREIAAGLVPPRLYVASAASYAGAQFVVALLRSGQPGLQVVDVRPLPQGDSRGLTLFYLAIAFVFGGYFAATVVTTLVGPASPTHGGAALRCGALVGFCVCAGLVGSGVARAIGTVPGHFWAVAGVGMLVAAAAAMATSALQSGLGIAGTLVAMVAFVMLGNSSAGGAYPGSFTPPLWHAIGPWLPTGAGVSALRAAVYFDWTNVVGRLLVLAAYAVVGAAATIALGWRRGLRAPELEVATAAAL